VGFYGTLEKLKIPDIMARILDRVGKRKEAELETLQALAQEFQTRGYTLQDAFSHLDTNESGTVTAKEFQDALRAMRIEINKQTMMNIVHLFDVNGDNSIQMEEFERLMSKYMGSVATGRV
jgi:Ca2+-binding EF-hand superfamily protein